MADAAEGRRRALVHPALVGLHHRADPERPGAAPAAWRAKVVTGDDGQDDRVGAEAGHGRCTGPIRRTA